MTENNAEESRITLLYVEDEPETRELVSGILASRYPDLRLVVAANGEEGIALLRKYLPEIVITDINMPIVSGFTLAEEIKAFSPATEIIALSAYSNSSHLLKAIEIGFSHFVLKPVDIDQLFKVVDKSLGIVRSGRLIAHQNSLIRELNSDLAEKAAELEAANRELESFNYTVAHDLRSPMVTVSGFSQILLEKYADLLDDSGKEYLQMINDGVGRMNDLISALLKFSMSQRKQVAKKWISLSEMAVEVKKSLQLHDPLRKVTFRIAEDVKGFCEPQLMQIVLDNLLGNAWKYSMNKDDVLIEFGTVSRDDDLVYFVRDNGAGFDQQEASSLFLPFQRLQTNGGVEGFGIGLATVARIIQRHGGRIWAEGKKGEGATFYFTL